MGDTAKHLVAVFGVLAALLALSGGLIWAERRLLALFQDRLGPNRVGPAGLLQPVADMVKIFMKEDWVPPLADKWVFVMAPGIVLVATLTSFAVVPFYRGGAVADLDVSLLFFLALSSMAVYSVTLAGWSTGNKYGLLGAMRAAGQMLSYEVFMGMSLMGVVLLAGSFDLQKIVAAQAGLWYIVPQFAGFVVFFIAGLAETRRLPFDLPEAENELVAGYHTDYSGLKFALFYFGEYVGITLVSALTVTLFFGGWRGPLLPPVVWFAVKTFIFIGLFILIRASLPRFTFERLISTGWKYLLPLTLLNLVVTGAFVVAGSGVPK